MQSRNPRSTSRDDLLSCRMAMLGLDLSAIESGGGQVFETIKRRCTSCDFGEACELDLRRDPNDPVWETYCPNTATLIALPEAWWLGAR
jgi:hypothetical protein